MLHNPFGGTTSTTGLLSSDAAYSQALAKAGTDRLVVVDCYADWCGPCRAISPTVDALAKEYLDVVFVKLDVDVLGEIAAELGVTSMPTFLFFRCGKAADAGRGSHRGCLERLRYLT